MDKVEKTNEVCQHNYRGECIHYFKSYKICS